MRSKPFSQRRVALWPATPTGPARPSSWPTGCAGTLPSPDALTEEQRIGYPDAYPSLVLHAEPDGSFSIVALTWRPGR